MVNSIFIYPLLQVDGPRKRAFWQLEEINRVAPSGYELARCAYRHFGATLPLIARQIDLLQPPRDVIKFQLRQILHVSIPY